MESVRAFCPILMRVAEPGDPSGSSGTPRAGKGNQDTPIFSAHGSHDGVVIPARGAAARAWLGERGYQVEAHDYPMGHEVCEAELRDLGAWFEGVFAAA